MSWRCALALVLLPILGRAAETATPVITYQNDRLTVRLNEVPIGDVLAALAKATGATIRGQPREQRTVTAHFDALPLSPALRKLLGDQDFTLRYAKDRLAVVELLGPGEARSSPPSPTTTTLPGRRRRPVPPNVGDAERARRRSMRY